MSDHKKIAVTGATGKLGRLVIEQLLQKLPPSQIVAAVRSPEKAADLAQKGVLVREADYSKPETLDRAFADVEKVLLISSNELGQRVAQHQAAITAAKRAGVKLLAYTSVLHADRSQLVLAAEHKATEELIRSSGLPFVFLRNGWYIENYTESLAPAIAHGVLLGSTGSGKVAAATRADYAAAAVAVLTGSGHEGKVYELAGDTGFTKGELAAAAAKISAKPVAYQDLPEAAYAEALVSVGVPQVFANLLADSDVGVARGELDDSTGDLRHLIGRPTTLLEPVLTAALQ